SLHAGSYAHLVEGQQGLLLTAHEGPRLGQESLQEGGVEGEPATEFLHTRSSSSSRIRWPCTLITLVGPIVVSRCESDPCGCTCPCRSSRGRHQPGDPQARHLNHPPVQVASQRIVALGPRRVVVSPDEQQRHPIAGRQRVQILRR